MTGYRQWRLFEVGERGVKSLNQVTERNKIFICKSLILWRIQKFKVALWINNNLPIVTVKYILILATVNPQNSMASYAYIATQDTLCS